MPDRPTIVFKPRKEKAARQGYPWVFANQLAEVTGGPARGDVVTVLTSKGEALGQALYHDESLIAGRFLTRNVECEVGRAFFEQRLDQALKLRESAFPETDHVRLVFGESDGLPGVTIDRYGDVLTFTALSYGMEQRRELMLDHLEGRLAAMGTPVRAVVERNDVPIREKDGLEQRSGVIRGVLDGPVEIEENGVRFGVDVLHGIKTGFFLDQRLNRQLVASLADGRRVLDLFCGDGGFGLQALAHGAESAHFVDASKDATSRVEHNAGRSRLAEFVTTEAADVLDRIGDMAEAQRGAYDLIVLDPPGFARSRRDVEAATRAYQRINISALQMLEPGGVLATGSSSQALSESDFETILSYSAETAGLHLRRLARGTQPPDHPVLEAMPETHYLTFSIFQVMDDELPGRH